MSRTFSNSAPIHLAGGAAYAKYQLAPVFSLAGRFEYVSDRGGFFSGATQVLKSDRDLAAEGWLPDSVGVPPRPLEPAILSDEHARSVEEVPEHGAHGPALVVRRKASIVVETDLPALAHIERHPIRRLAGQEGVQ